MTIVNSYVVAEPAEPVPYSVPRLTLPVLTQRNLGDCLRWIRTALVNYLGCLGDDRAEVGVPLVLSAPSYHTDVFYSAGLYDPATTTQRSLVIAMAPAIQLLPERVQALLVEIQAANETLVAQRRTVPSSWTVTYKQAANSAHKATQQLLANIEDDAQQGAMMTDADVGAIAALRAAVSRYTALKHAQVVRDALSATAAQSGEALAALTGLVATTRRFGLPITRLPDTTQECMPRAVHLLEEWLAVIQLWTDWPECPAGEWTRLADVIPQPLWHRMLALHPAFDDDFHGYRLLSEFLKPRPYNEVGTAPRAWTAQPGQADTADYATYTFRGTEDLLVYDADATPADDEDDDDEDDTLDEDDDFLGDDDEDLFGDEDAVAPQVNEAPAENPAEDPR